MLNKITAFTKTHQMLDQRPSAVNGLTYSQLQQWWDSSPEELRVALNSLVDALSATTGASEIGATVAGLSGSTVQALLESLSTLMVKSTGDQTIAGTKTFSASPVVPTPTAANQATTKGYVDSSIGSVVLGQIPDDTLTNAKLSSDVKVGSLAELNTTAKASVIAAINELVAGKVALSSGSGTIPTTGWVANTGDYAFKLDLAVAGILATDYVMVNLANDSIDVAQDAELSPNITEYAGGITFFCKTIPALSIPFTWKGLR